PIVAMEVTAAYAAVFQMYGSPRISAPPAASQIALVGVLVRLLTRCHTFEAGGGPARGDPGVHPGVAVTRGMPQNSWRPRTPSSSSSAPDRPIASSQICPGATTAVASPT